MNDGFVLASDLGSSGCKTMLIDARGNVLGTARQEYPNSYPRPGWVEQNPDDWYAAFCGTVRRLLGQLGTEAGKIAGVGIAGVTHTCVLLDGRGGTLANPDTKKLYPPRYGKRDKE